MIKFFVWLFTAEYTIQAISAKAKGQERQPPKKGL